MSNEYSSSKVAYHFDLLSKLASLQQGPPVHVLLVLSDLCSHDCSFCLFRASGYETSENFGDAKSKNPNRKIPYDKVIEVIDDCKAMGVKSIEFTGGGEPTIHPEFSRILEHAVGTGLDLSMITHGANLKDDSNLVKMKWLRISLDAGTEGTYSKIHGVSTGTFHRVIENIRLLKSMKDRIGAGITLGVSFVATADNCHEIAEACRIVKEAGADSFRISAQLSPSGETGFHAKWHADAMKHSAEASSLENETFRVLNHFSDKTDLGVTGRPTYGKCWYQEVTTFIGGDQNVYRCCRTSYQERGILGSIKEQSFRSLWESQEKQELVKCFDAQGCTACHVNSINKEIARLMSPPSHVNFV